MADYREKIKIDIETEIDTDKISTASETFESLSGALDGLEGSLSGLEVDDLNEGLEELQEIGFEGLDQLENRAESITETIGKTHQTVTELKKILGKKIEFEARLDTDQFIADLSKKLGEDIDEKDLTVPVAPKGKLKTPDAQELESDIADFMDDVQNLVDENEDLHIQPRVASEAKFDSGERGRISRNISKQLGNTNPKITPKLNMEEIADEDLNKLEKLSDALEVVETKKEDVSDENESLDKRNDDTSDSTDKEAKSFRELIKEGDNLTSVKRAAGRANEYLSDVSLESAKSLLREKDSVELTSEELEAADQILEDLAGSQKNLGSITDDTAEETDVEVQSLEDLVQSGDSAADMKRKVSKANKNLGGISEETAEKIGIEGDALEVLRESGMLFEETADEVTDTSRSLSKTLSSVNESVDETGDSLRAASEIGEIFEDGFGSLSVNLGAFTIALRNFVTQIPLLITALGSVAEAAAGAASAFISVAGAISLAIGAGALTRAQQLQEEYSQIEDLGQSIQVIFQNVKDTLIDAVGEALNPQTVDLFRRSVEGVATVVNLLAQMVDKLMTTTNDDLYSIQKAFDDLGNDALPAVVDVVNSLIYSFQVLGEETVSALTGILQLLANLIKKSTDFVDRIDNLGSSLSQFKETISALSELGLAIGSGLLPVFETFSSIMETFANVLNQVNDEILGNVVTFGVAIFAFSRLSSVASTLVTILPNIALGFANLNTKVMATDSSMKAFQATVVGVNSKVATFLSQISAFSGISAMVGALGGMGERFRQIAFRSSSATARFEALALGTNVTAQQLYELAVAGKLSEDMMQTLEAEAEDVKQELRELQLSLQLTDEQLETLGDDFDVDVGDFADDIENPDNLLNSSIPLTNLFSDSDEASEKSKEIAKNLNSKFGKGLREAADIDKVFNVEQLADGITPLATAQYDLSRATSYLTDTYGEMDVSLKGAGKSLRALGGDFLRLRKAISNVLSSTAAYIGATLKQMYTDGVAATLKERLSMSKLKSAAASYAESSALLTYIGTAISATIANYGLATSIAAVTGGLSILLAVLGALAVGIITNFDKIKSSASGMLDGIIPVFNALKEILLTVFVETWNIIVSAISSLQTAFAPLFSLVMDFVGIFTTLFGMNQKAGESFLSLSNIVGVVVGALKTVSTAVQLLFGSIGVLTNLIFTALRASFYPLTTSLQLIAAGLRLAYEQGKEFIDNVLKASTGTGIAGYIEKTIEAINSLREGFDNLPDNVESALNSVVDLVNDAIDRINEAIPYLELRGIDRIEITGGGLETDREELAADTKGAKEGITSVASNVINMKTENNQTVNQTVNADPQDKSTVSRVVEDAIERANRFDRKRAGQ